MHPFPGFFYANVNWKSFFHLLVCYTEKIKINDAMEAKFFNFNLYFVALNWFYSFQSGLMKSGSKFAPEISKDLDKNIYKKHLPARVCFEWIMYFNFYLSKIQNSCFNTLHPLHLSSHYLIVCFLENKSLIWFFQQTKCWFFVFQRCWLDALEFESSHFMSEGKNVNK